MGQEGALRGVGKAEEEPLVGQQLQVAEGEVGVGGEGAVGAEAEGGAGGEAGVAQGQAGEGRPPGVQHHQEALALIPTAQESGRRVRPHRLRLPQPQRALPGPQGPQAAAQLQQAGLETGGRGGGWC